MVLKATGRARIRVLLIVVAVAAGLAALLWWLDRRSSYERSGENSIRAEETPRPQTPTPTPTSTPTPVATPPDSDPNAPGAESSPLPEKPNPANDQSGVGNILFTPNLVIPVAGVKSSQLLDTFADARSEGRMHDAIDIPAPQGTAVIAAADGEIVKLFLSERGGTTIYQLSTDKKVVFYYAHLQGYAEGLVVGKLVRQGEVIGYVGDTGNAGAGNFHLHFSIAVLADPKRYWEGININPYPLLHK